MFGIGDKKKEAPVGAKEKRRVAMEMARGGGDNITSGKGKGHDDTLPIMIAICGLSCALALMLMKFTWPNGPSFHLPDPDLDRLLFKMPPPSFVGDADINVLVVMFIRGVVFFVLAGIVPGIVKLLSLTSRRGKKGNPPIWMFWIVIVFLLTGALILHNL